MESSLSPKTLLQKIGRDIKEAVAGSEQDFTEGSLRRAIFLLSVPMVLEMMMESLFGIVDVFFVAKLGSDAVATVGLTESLLTIVFAVGIGISMGTTAIVARRVGEKDLDGARSCASQAIILCFLASLPICFAGIFFAPDLLRLMGASTSIIETGSTYTRLMLAGNFVIMYLFINNAIFRGAGDAAIAMRVLWLSNAINIILCPCFIRGLGPFPELGVTGAAVATTIGRGCGVLFQFYNLGFLGKARGRISIFWRDLHWKSDILWNLVKISAGGIFQFIIAMAGYVGMIRIVAVFGSAAIAGYTIAIRIVVVAILPSWGMANAAATLVGQNLGAGKPERAEKSVWTAGLSNAIFLGCLGFFFISFAEYLISFFSTEPEVIRIAVEALRWISYGYVFYGYGMVIVQAFNGAGDTLTPTIINFFCYWLFQIPLAYALSTAFGYEERGVFMAITIAETVLAIVGLIVFRRGNWKLKKV